MYKTQSDASPTLLYLFFLFLVALPCFLATYFSRDRSNRKNLLKALLWSVFASTGAAVLVAGSLFALFAYLMSPTRIDHAQEPLTVEQARHLKCPIPLPDSARHVQFAQFDSFRTWEILVRFEASVEICQRHAQAVMDEQTRLTNQPHYPLQLFPLEKTPLPEIRDALGPQPWFDCERVTHGITTFVPHGLQTGGSLQFWIDEERGVFYCKITD